MRFKYKGFNAEGHERVGTIEASSKEDAAGRLRSEHNLFINTLEQDDSAPAPQAPPVAQASKSPEPCKSPVLQAPPAPKQRTLDEDLEKGMEVIRLLKQAKIPKKLLERAKEEMVLCLVRKAMLK